MKRDKKMSTKKSVNPNGKRYFQSETISAKDKEVLEEILELIDRLKAKKDEFFQKNSK